MDGFLQRVDVVIFEKSGGLQVIADFTLPGCAPKRLTPATLSLVVKQVLRVPNRMLSGVGRLRLHMPLSNSIDNAFGVACFILRGLFASLGLGPTTPFC